MAIPKVNKQDILNALKYIDKNGIPDVHKSTKYNLVTENKKYPPKYVIAIADHLANGTDILTEGFNAVEAKKYLQTKGFIIKTNQEKYELTITAKSIVSTDKRFTIDNLSLGDKYKPLDVYFQKADNTIIRRTYYKKERHITNQTMPRIAFQIFEKYFIAMPSEERENFPVCRYNQKSNMIRGIFTSFEEYKKHYKSIEFMRYIYDNDQKMFVMYCWNIFSPLLFTHECLKRFGEEGDKFILTYCEKDEKDTSQPDIPDVVPEELILPFKGYKNPYSTILLESKNIIFHGAPGTGKTYLARKIATDIISNGSFDDYTLLSEEQKKQMEFVQFHPSYDYSDFVEGLRPKLNEDGSMGFELQDGIFKRFINQAKRNFEDSQKSKETIEKEASVKEIIEDFFLDIEPSRDKFTTINGNIFYIASIDDKHIGISIPGNATFNKLNLNMDELRMILESGIEFEQIKDITKFFGKQFATQGYSYYFAIYKAIKARKVFKPKVTAIQEEMKKYIFIIDEINRGDMSKILGELFFAIDPSYRGKAGEISTQYSNLHSDPVEKFYIPENVYIIGTMNDIDRSVDSFDFAMRRRFRFIELKANEHINMLSNLENEELRAEAIKRMTALNKEIATVEGLNENYHIGASYFLKLNILNFDQLWTDYLQPLLSEYIHGIFNEDDIMNNFSKAYGCKKLNEGSSDETSQN